MRVTSAGIIRNEDAPRVGIVSANSLASWIYDEIDQGIDIYFEEFLEELAERGLDPDSMEWQREVDRYENDSRVMLFGDWRLNPETERYEIDRNGSKGFAAMFNSDSGNISVEFSKTLKRCMHTSPCYVMADGSGPCGDLDTEGDSVLAYSLPAEFFDNAD